MKSKKPSEVTSLHALQELLYNAEKSLSLAKNLLTTLVPNHKKAAQKSWQTWHTYHDGNNQIVEGIFNWRDMVGSDGKTYPVPANYASKSKILEWSQLKATIKSDGSLQYKIIKEVPYITSTGTLIRDEDKFVVISHGTLYQILPAAVTYVQARVGDRLSIRVPQDSESHFAAIEAVVPAEIGLPVA